MEIETSEHCRTTYRAHYLCKIKSGQSFKQLPVFYFICVWHMRVTRHIRQGTSCYLETYLYPRQTVKTTSCLKLDSSENLYKENMTMGSNNPSPKRIEWGKLLSILSLCCINFKNCLLRIPTTGHRRRWLW